MSRVSQGNLSEEHSRKLTNEYGETAQRLRESNTKTRRTNEYRLLSDRVQFMKPVYGPNRLSFAYFVDELWSFYICECAIEYNLCYCSHEFYH